MEFASWSSEPGTTDRGGSLGGTDLSWSDTEVEIW